MRVNLLLADSSEYPSNINKFITYFEFMLEKHPDIKIIYIDHTEILPLEADDTGLYASQAKFMSALTQFIVKNNIIVYLIVQQPKIATKNVELAFKGSGAIKEQASLYFQLDPISHNGNAVFSDQDRVLRIYKNREGKSVTCAKDDSDGSTSQHLFFNGLLFVDKTSFIVDGQIDDEQWGAFINET